MRLIPLFASESEVSLRQLIRPPPASLSLRDGLSVRLLMATQAEEERERERERGREREVDREHER